MEEREVLGSGIWSLSAFGDLQLSLLPRAGCRRSVHGLQEPVVKRIDVHRNSGLAEAQGFIVAVVADMQILKKMTFLEGKSEERDIVNG
ncbi:hypothetical protein D8674_035580 [Pyrus ussuriensis x Pyrus communis]|uniref:Uncharacterized protein n=1 Tax=Pyrus ussuriensis x Pyrus communis TaxID=2448454 RepID=A0A5N5GR89_9ROSA|nr:hypothetical protein D8674_035580 [Pyrus ussuriensis x Pyrus communis]